MKNVLTATVTEITIEEFENCEDLLLTLQLCEESKTFMYPFSSMSISVGEISPQDSLFIIVSTQQREIGHTQVVLESLASSSKIEKTILLTQTEQSPERNKQKTWQQKRITVGKIKLIIECETLESSLKDYEEDHETQLRSIKDAFETIAGIVENNWRVEIPKADAIAKIGLTIFDAREGILSMSEEDVKHLQVVLLGFNEKLKAFELLQVKLRNSDDYSRQLLKINEEIQQLVEISKQNYENLRYQSEEDYQILFAENQKLLNSLAVQEKQAEAQQKIIDSYESRILLLESSLRLQDSHDSLLIHHSSIIDSLKSSLSESEECRSALLGQYKQSLLDLDSLNNYISSEMLQLSADNSELQKSLNHYIEKSSLQESIIEKQKLELQAAGSHADYLQKQLSAHNALESQYLQSEQRFKHISEKLQDCEIESSKTLCNFNSFKSQLSEEKENLLLHARELQQENMKLQSSLIKQSKDLSTASISHSEQVAQMTSLEELLVLKEDNYDLHEEIAASQAISRTTAQQAYKELEFMSEYLLGQTEHNLMNVRVMNRLKTIAEDKEVEIMILREMVMDLQRKRALYIPVKDDVIDGAVADYVNTRTTEIPFTREDQGVYIFGSKRVFVKLEHGRIISN